MTHHPPPPAWVERIRFFEGQDLLGLRVPVQRLSNHCLNGVTTITPQIRYLGFYCWMLRNYWQQRRRDHRDAFTEFSARSECALVLGNLLVDPRTPYLLGSKDVLELIAAGEPFTLQPLLGRNAPSVYGNVAAQLGLTREAEGPIVHLTPSGAALADATGTALEACDLGHTLARTGPPAHIQRSDLKRLGELARVNQPSEAEKTQLGQILVPAIPSDEDARRRAATYGLILSRASSMGRRLTPGEFLAWIASGEAVEPAFGPIRANWQAYLTRDLIAVVHEATLAGIVSRLRVAPGFTPAQVILRDVFAQGETSKVLDEVIDGAFAGLTPASTMVDAYDRLCAITADARPLDGCLRWSGHLSEESLMRPAGKQPAAALLLAPIVWALARRRYESMAEGLAAGLFAAAKAGPGRMGLTDVIFPQVDRWLADGTTIGQAAIDTARRTVDQHLRIVWSRRRSEPWHDTAALVTDGDRWRARGEFGHGRTGSRLEQAFSWLTTLGWWSDAGLSEAGRIALMRAVQAQEIAG